MKTLSRCLVVLVMASRRKSVGSRSLRQRNTESAVQDSIEDNFPGFTQQQIFGIKRGEPPLSLYDTLARDKRLWKQGLITMGPQYYKEKRSLFSPKDKPSHMLANLPELEDPGEIPLAWRAAMRDAKGPSQDREKLIQWFDACTDLPPIVVRAMCKWCAQIDPGPKSVLRDMVLSFAAAAARTGAFRHEQSKAALDIIACIVDVCLQGAWHGATSEDLAAFMASYKGALSFFCQLETLELAVAAIVAGEPLKAKDAILEAAASADVLGICMASPRQKCLADSVKKVTVARTMATLARLAVPTDFSFFRKQKSPRIRVPISITLVPPPGFCQLLLLHPKRSRARLGAGCWFLFPIPLQCSARENVISPPVAGRKIDSTARQ